MSNRNRHLGAILVVCVSLALGACASGAQSGPDDPGGPMNLLPGTIPAGIDPNDGSAGP